jgi:hypothetical protein
MGGIFDHDSFCGLYCGACEILIAYRNGRDRGVPARWEDLPAPLRDNIPRAEVKCHGCRTDTVFEGCRGCRIRSCARSKGVPACPACSEFPCEMVHALRERIPLARNRLPHTMTIFGDIDIATRDGVKAWLEYQRQRWTCPRCGTPFTWYQECCRKCGCELKAMRGY